jgi:hypothetical protein
MSGSKVCGSPFDLSHFGDCKAATGVIPSPRETTCTPLKPLRVLVTGGRFYADTFTVYEALSKINIGLLIHGGAPGADSLAADYAESKGIPQRPFDVTREEWHRLGKKAGPLRNQRMLDEGKPDLVVAFPGSRGTADMLRRAKKIAGLEVREIK